MGFRAIMSVDQVNIKDETDTRLNFDTVDYDTNGEYDTGLFIWTPKVLVPTVVRLTAHATWTPSIGPIKPGYGKIYFTKNPSSSNVDFCEGRIDGPLSLADPGILASCEDLCQPGDSYVVEVWFATGADGHSIQGQSTSDDRRTFFCGSY